jgi:hypothetical protein
MKAKTYALDDIIVVVMRAAASPHSSRRLWTAGSVEPDITLKIFFIDRPLDGFGALELIEPE